MVAALAVLPTDCDMVKGMKHRMSNALNHRLPVTERRCGVARPVAAQLGVTNNHTFAEK